MTAPVGTGSTSGLGVDVGLEVVTRPGADIDQATEFYSRLGWRLDADLTAGDDFRVVQFTPPHSQCSIHFGRGLTVAEPGSVDRLLLIVKDIDAARRDLMSRGVDVTEVEDRRPPDADATTGRPASPTRRSVIRMGTADCCRRRRFGAARSRRSPPHDWWDCYAAAYMNARQRGTASDDAATAAARYLAGVKQVVVPSG